MEGIYAFAGRRVRIRSLYSLVHEKCADYRAEGAPAFTVETGAEEIAAERARADGRGYGEDYLETLAVCRKIAETMPAYDAFLFHGSAVAADGRGVIFTAPSGTGKSTHARLWREMLGARAKMINDDKPLIRVEASGQAAVFGTPWDGKHHLSANISAPLEAVCLLERGPENRIREIGKGEALPALLVQTYRPREAEAVRRTLRMLERMQVRLYRLRCNMDPAAAEISFRGIFGP